MNDRALKIGRLAFREEGTLWNAYYALPDTMLDALHIGSIKLSAIRTEKIKQMYMDTMREVVADIIEEHTGLRPEWVGGQRAPEHERGGKA